MAHEKSKKRIIVDISSSDELKSVSDDHAAVEISSSTSCTDEDDGSDCERCDSDVIGGEDCDADNVDKPDADSMYNKVIQFIRERTDMQQLKLDECKAYLRRHKLRLSGNKEEYIQRIEEHWKLKDGSGEVFYPRESFKIHCTGDVCRGDIVLFHQKVKQIIGRKRTVGRRTVAGRIIKESYGATRQQHTFTVEVLWNRGAKKLDPLFPLLVKGRNLYKMRTFRQPWKNEKDRSEVLDEKHRRGNAARAVRDKRREKTAMNKNESSAFKGSRHCKRLRLSNTRETSREKKNHINEGSFSKQNAGPSRGSASQRHQNSAGPSRGSASHRHQNSPNQGRRSRSPSRSYNYPSQNFIPTELHTIHYHGGFASDAGLPYPYPPPYLSTRQMRWRDISHESYNEPGLSQTFFPTESLNYNYHGGSSASVAGLSYPYPPPYSRHTSSRRRISDGSYSEPSYSHSTYGNDAASYNYPRFTGSRHSLRYTSERYERR